MLVDLNDISEKNVHKEQGFFLANYFVFKAYLFVLNLIMLLLVGTLTKDKNINDNEDVTDGQGIIFFSNSKSSKQNGI